MLTDTNWTDWLPIHAWAIEQGNRVVLVDTGETARVLGLSNLYGWKAFDYGAPTNCPEASDSALPWHDVWS
jgi:hypothetical protein